MKKLLLILLLAAAPALSQVYRNTTVGYQLVLFPDGTFLNGTCGYALSPYWGGPCHSERGTYTWRGDSVYMRLEFIDDIVAVNPDYGAGIRRADSLSIRHYGGVVFVYKFVGNVPVPPPVDTVYVFEPVLNMMLPNAQYEYYSGTLLESTLLDWIANQGFVVQYVGTKSSTTGRVTVRGFKRK